MAYIITRLCRDCVDTACVAVCPVDCIYRYTGDDRASFPNQLYIHPDECIDCGACEPECPWQAIFEEAATPSVFVDDVKLNAAMVDNRDSFEVSPHEEKPQAERRADRGQQEEVELGGVSPGPARARRRMTAAAKNLAVVSVIGRDQKGVVARVSHLPRRLQLNIEDIEQRVVEGLFIMTMLVDLADVSHEPRRAHPRPQADRRPRCSSTSRCACTASGCASASRVLVSREPHCLEQLIADRDAGPHRRRPRLRALEPRGAAADRRGGRHPVRVDRRRPTRRRTWPSCSNACARTGRTSWCSPATCRC